MTQDRITLADIERLLKERDDEPRMGRYEAVSFHPPPKTDDEFIRQQEAVRDRLMAAYDQAAKSGMSLIGIDHGKPGDELGAKMSPDELRADIRRRVGSFWRTADENERARQFRILAGIEPSATPAPAPRVQAHQPATKRTALAMALSTIYPNPGLLLSGSSTTLGNTEATNGR